VGVSLWYESWSEQMLQPAQGQRTWASQSPKPHHGAARQHHAGATDGLAGAEDGEGPLVSLIAPAAFENRWNGFPMRRKVQMLTNAVEIKEANGKYVRLRGTWPYFIILLLDRSGYTYFQVHFMYGKVWICVNKKFSSISCHIQQKALTTKIKISTNK